MILFLLCLLLASPLCAHQPFESLFMDGGIAPLYTHSVHKDVLVLQSPEQFVRFVTKTNDTVLVYLDKSSRAGAASDLASVVSLSKKWPRPMRVVMVDAATHMYLIKAVAHTARMRSLSLPSVVVFVQGKAVLPSVAIGGHLERDVAARIAHMQQHVAYDSGSWWSRGVALVQHVWRKFSQYLFAW